MNIMRNIRKLYVFKTVTMALALLITAMLIAATLACSSAQEGKALFEAKCAECHPLDYAFREKKSLAEWYKTTETMARYSEGSITKKEAKKIAKYLASVHP